MARRAWISLIYILVALYIANIGFEIIKISDFGLNKWILLAAAIFIFIESFKYFREYPTY